MFRESSSVAIAIEPVARGTVARNGMSSSIKGQGAMDLSLTFLMPPRYLHTSPWGRQGKGESHVQIQSTRHDTTRHDLQTDSQCMSVHQRVTSMIPCIHQLAGFSIFKPQRQALDEEHRFEESSNVNSNLLLLTQATKLGASPSAPWLRNT